MRLLSASLVVVFALVASSTFAGTYVVDSSGGGDFEDLRVAWYTTGEGDTLLLVAGTYYAAQDTIGWPLRIDGSVPALVGQAGAAQTEIRGDGVVSAFRLLEYSNVHLEGIAFREFGALLDRSYSPEEGMTLTFIDNIIEGCGSWYALDARSCTYSSVIQGNLITGNPGTGIYLYHNSGLIEDNEISHNGGGIRGSCCEEPTIQRNHVHHNAGGGIGTGFYAYITDNTIEHNGGSGISTSSTTSDSRIEHNIIRFNGGGIVLHMYSSLQFHFNDVYGNEPYNVECTPYLYGAEFDATMNWWGTTDPAVIAAGILDCSDDPEVMTCVVFDPWCTSPGCGTTAVSPMTWGAIKSLYRFDAMGR